MADLRVLSLLSFFATINSFESASAAGAQSYCDLVASALKLEQEVAAFARRNSSRANEVNVSEFSKSLDQINNRIGKYPNQHFQLGKEVAQVQNQTQAVLFLISAGLHDQAIATLTSVQYDRSLRSLENRWAHQECSQNKDVEPTGQERFLSGSAGMLTSSPPTTWSSAYRARTGKLDEADRPSGLHRANAGGLFFIGIILILATALLWVAKLLKFDLRPWSSEDYTPSRRRYDRFDCGIPCLIKVGECAVFATRCHNISREGFSILCSERTNYGDPAVVQMAGAILRCEPVWSGQKTSGFRFDTELDDDKLLRMLSEDESDGQSDTPLSSRSAA